MSASQFDEFDRRMRRINRRHTKLSQGYVTSVNSDGLVVAKPRRRRTGKTIRGVALMIVAIMLFKGFLHAKLGPTAYQQRVDTLAAGSVVEQGGAWIMTADPVTLWLSGQFSSYL